MDLCELSEQIPKQLLAVLSQTITELRPAQEKAVKAGLLEGVNLLVCTPTASGKTLIAELAAVKGILSGVGKALYIVPLKALASEKYKEIGQKYKGLFKTALSIGELDSAEPGLADKDLIFVTSEKLDSLIRHHAPWLRQVKTVIIDEIHLLNDPSRGPTLEILITLLKQMLPSLQLLGLSATIGNPQELADWLDARLVEDTWRPVQLEEGIYLAGNLHFHTSTR